MSGGWAGVVLEETLWRHLFAANSRSWTSFTAFSLTRTQGYPSLQRSAMQGFVEDYTGTAAARK